MVSIILHRGETSPIFQQLRPMFRERSDSLIRMRFEVSRKPASREKDICKRTARVVIQPGERHKNG